MNAKNANGLSALPYFLEMTPPGGGAETILNLLIAAGADVNSRDSKGRTPIFFACKNHHLDDIRTLIAHGADVNAKDRIGQTVLMSCFDKAALKVLIEAGLKAQ